MSFTPFEEALRYYLNTTGTVLGDISQRVYLGHLVKGDHEPYLVIFNITRFPLHAHDGPGTLQQRTYQLSVFDESPSGGIAIADALRRLIDGFTGLMGAPGAQLSVGSILFAHQNYTYEKENAVHGFHQDYAVQYTES